MSSEAGSVAGGPLASGSHGAGPVPGPVAGPVAGAIVAKDDLACSRCGYALMGIALSGTCPECGQPAAISRDLARHPVLHPRWRRAFAIGAWLFAGAAVGIVVLRVITYASIASPAIPLGKSMAVVVGLLQFGLQASMLAGAWLLARPVRAGNRDRDWLSVAVRVTASVAAMLMLVTFLGVVPRLVTPNWWSWWLQVDLLLRVALFPLLLLAVLARARRSAGIPVSPRLWLGIGILLALPSLLRLVPLQDLLAIGPRLLGRRPDPAATTPTFPMVHGLSLLAALYVVPLVVGVLALRTRAALGARARRCTGPASGSE